MKDNEDKDSISTRLIELIEKVGEGRNIWTRQEIVDELVKLKESDNG